MADTFQSDTILSARLILRRYTKEDVDFIVNCSHSFEAAGDYLSLEKLTRNLYFDRLASNFYWNPKARAFTIQSKDGDKIGLIRYWTDPSNSTAALITVQITVPQFRRLGYGTEAQKILIKRLFSTGGFTNIEMHTDVKNIAQQKCLAKLGFSLVKSITYKDGAQERNGNLYRLTESDYTAIAEYIYNEP